MYIYLIAIYLALASYILLVYTVRIVRTTIYFITRSRPPPMSRLPVGFYVGGQLRRSTTVYIVPPKQHIGMYTAFCRYSLFLWLSQLYIYNVVRIVYVYLTPVSIRNAGNGAIPLATKCKHQYSFTLLMFNYPPAYNYPHV